MMSMGGRRPPIDIIPLTPGEAPQALRRVKPVLENCWMTPKQERKHFSMSYTSSSLKEERRGKQLLVLLQKGFAINWLLTFCGLLMVVVLLASLLGVVVDHRIITGMPAWVKPAKFAISISVYNFTLLWFLHFIRGHKRLVSFLANG